MQEPIERGVVPGDEAAERLPRELRRVAGDRLRGQLYRLGEAPKRFTTL
jgi:hypothetical protein